MSEITLPGDRRDIAGAGARLSVAVLGQGTLIILMHGWPELGLSWRHQMAPLAALGYQVAVPDMRGYGASEQPQDPLDYRLDVIAQDMAAIAAALGHESFIAIGHDWGAISAWGTALRLGPARVRAVLGMSVPYAPPPPTPIPYADLMDRLYPDRFFYIRYFQPLGVAEAELDAADTQAFLKSIYWSISNEGVAAYYRHRMPRDARLLESFLPAPPGPLRFMSDAELAEYARIFRATGWRGPLNYYRNFDRNADAARALGDTRIHQPSGFIAGVNDPVLRMFPNQLPTMQASCTDYRMETLIEGAGHWVQQEAPQATMDAMAEFLRRLG